MKRLLSALSICTVLLGLQAPGAWGIVTSTTRVSVSSTGIEGNGDSGLFGGAVSISADGRFVAFASAASNLVPGDTNGRRDVFLRDVVGNTTELVSVATGGASGNGESSQPFVSASGRFVAFISFASDLVSGDTNGTGDIFVRDRTLGVTERVSVSSLGQQANNFSNVPAVTSDGRFVTFGSSASTLVPGDGNGASDVFVRDRLLSTTERVSISSSGTEANGSSQHSRISENGNLVFFESDASNLIPGDSNGFRDIFVRDRAAGTTTRVSLTSSGAQIATCCGASGTTISLDGRYVAFTSQSIDLVPGKTSALQDVFVRDRLAGTTERVSLTASGAAGNGGSSGALTQGISADGRFVAFNSFASNLVTGDTNGVTDVFVRDRVSSTTQRVSISSTSTQSNGTSANATISADGTTVGFDSGATNLVPNDTNGRFDVFVNAVQGAGPGAPASLVLSPKTATNTVGTQHTVTATVRDASANPVPGVTVRFSVTGSNSATGASMTNASGQASFAYVGTSAGADAIVAFADTDNDGTQDPGEPSDTASKTWNPGPPASLTLSPKTATNPVGADHCVQAAVRDAFGNPVQGVTVRFSVPTAGATFASPSSGSDVTDAAGGASFCFTASLPGTDTIRAFADSDGDGIQDPGEPSDTATKIWTLPSNTERCEVKITQGGWIVANNGDTATFGGNAKVANDGSSIQGQQQYRDHGPAQPRHVHSVELTAITCGDDLRSATIFGTASIDGAGTSAFRIDVTDVGEPGANDSYGLMLSDGYASGQQRLRGGNVQIHS